MPPRRKRKSSAVVEEADVSEARAESVERDSDAQSSDGEDERKAGAGAAGTKAKRRRVAASNVSLLDICKDHGGETAAAAMEWVKRHSEDHTAATAELLSLIVQAAGCTREVREEDVEGEVDELVSEIKDELVKEGYVDLFRGKGHKQFVSAYLRLWDRLVQLAWEQEALLGHLLLEKVCHLLIGLSSSDVRPLRYVATLTACHLATSLARIMAVLSRERDIAQRQAAAETRKKANKAAQERAAAFERTVRRHHSQINELQSHVNSIFQGITTSRFRDKDEEIRAVVIDGVGNWAHLYPAVYLRDLYLKYLAWALSDRAPVVREAAVDALIGVLGERDNLAAMNEFIERFTSRFLELPGDVDDAVAVKGVKLLTLLVKLEQVPYSEVTGAFKLLLEESVALRAAAAELVSELVQEGGKQHMLQLQERQKGRRKSVDSLRDEELQLTGVLHLMQLLKTDEMDAEQRALLAAKVADSLFDRVGVLHDWKVYADALLDDSACEQRGQQATTDLVLLLQAAVQKACGGGLGLSSGHARKVRGRVKAGEVDHQQELTLAMSSVLLKLLRKFQADAIMAGGLASVVPHLKLQIFSLKKDERGLEDILRAVASLLAKHAAAHTTRPCLLALAHCANPGGIGPQHPAEGIFREAVEGVIARLAAAVKDLLSLEDAELAAEAVSEPEAACEEVFDAVSALSRAHQLLLISPAAAGDARLQDSLASLLKAAVEGRKLPEWLLANIVQCQALLLLWQAQQQLADGQLTHRGLAAAAADFVDGLHNLLLAEGGLQLRATCVACLADVLQVFRPETFKDTPPAVAEAAIKATNRHALAMWEAADSVLADESAAESGAATLAALGRLVLHEVEPFASLLPGKIASFLGSPNSDAAAVVKDLLQHVKKLHPTRMPSVYAGALQTAAGRAGEDPEQVLELGRKIAAAHTGLTAGAAETLTAIVNRTLPVALKEPLDGRRLLALKGLLPFLGRLPKDAAAAASGALAEAADRADNETREGSGWAAFLEARKALDDRERRLKSPASVLKKAGAAPKAGGRRISFKEANRRRAPRKSAAEVAESEDGSGSEAPAARSAERSPQVAPRFHAKTRRGSQAHAPAAEEPTEEEEEEQEQTGEEDEIHDSIQFSGGTLPNTAEGVPSGFFIADDGGEDSIAVGGGEEEEEEDEDMEEEEEEVMPRRRPRRA